MCDNKGRKEAAACGSEGACGRAHRDLDSAHKNADNNSYRKGSKTEVVDVEILALVGSLTCVNRGDLRSLSIKVSL